MKMEEKMVKILEFLQRNIYEIFLILTLFLSIMSVIYEDRIFAICCVFFAVFLILFNRYKEHDFVQNLVKKWL